MILSKEERAKIAHAALAGADLNRAASRLILARARAREDGTSDELLGEFLDGLLPRLKTLIEGLTVAVNLAAAETVQEDSDGRFRLTTAEERAEIQARGHDA
jgi:hypothetical protein